MNKENTSTCWICCIHFTNEHEKCLDHCHFSGKFLGWAHEKCNLARRTVNFTPVIGDNIQNYGLHHVCLALHECEPTSTMSVIPSTDEKYISLSIGVLIKTKKRKNGSEQKVFEYLRFIDSCMFLNSSLQKLVDNLPAEKMSILTQVFCKRDGGATVSDTTKRFLTLFVHDQNRKICRKRIASFAELVRCFEWRKSCCFTSGSGTCKESF